MNTAITDYEEFANNSEEMDFYIAPAIMDGYKPRKIKGLKRLLSIFKSKLPNKSYVFQNFKMTLFALMGFFTVYGVVGIVETITKLF